MIHDLSLADFITGGGGLVVGYVLYWLKTQADIKRATSESTVNLAKLKPELTAMALDTVEAANRSLRADNEILRGERDYYRERLNEALTELDEVSNDLRRAQEITAKLQVQITSLLNQDDLLHESEDNNG